MPRVAQPAQRMIIGVDSPNFIPSSFPRKRESTAPDVIRFAMCPREGEAPAEPCFRAEAWLGRSLALPFQSANSKSCERQEV